MPYPPKPPTGQGVAAALKRAGFNRSVPMPGTGRYTWDNRLIRGSEQVTAGYTVKTEGGQIRVRYRAGGPLVNDASVKHRHLMLLRCADALVRAGFRAQLDEGSHVLTVYGRQAGR